MSSVTQAFVLGAGLGTRLRPLTEELPKPLIPIFQKPLITFALDHLMAGGVESFVINTHRMPEKFEDVFPGESYRDYPVKLVNEPVLLETGGGIKNVEGILKPGPFLVYSGDILTDVALPHLIEEHFRAGNDVTLALRETGLATAIAFRDGRVVDIAGRHGIKGDYDFANISVWNPEIFTRIPPREKVSFIPILGQWIGQGGKIGGVILNKGEWFNIGSRAEYLEVHRVISNSTWRPVYVREPAWPEPVAPSAQVDPTAILRGCTVVGANGRVGPGAILEDTVLWPGAQIASQSELTRCIVRSHKTAAGTHRDIDI